MKLSAYQPLATATAQPRAFDLQYLVPMIVGEIGELFGQKAKSHWHGWEADKLQAELISEYGDVAWGTAMLLQTYGIDDIDPFMLTTRVAEGPWHMLLSRSHHLHLFYSTPGYLEKRDQWIGKEAELMWLTLDRNCREITGVTFEEVLNANLAKLASRAARGTLQGQGDHR